MKRILTLIGIAVFLCSFSACTAKKANITEEEAKKIALEHAGLAETDVNFVRIQKDSDNGRTEYEVEFYAANTEYDYEIDASNGKILSYDNDAEYYTPQPSNSNDSTVQNGSYITEDEALAAALQHAGVARNDASLVSVHLDNDNRRTVYDVEFHVGFTEYNYEIDATTKEIVEYEREGR